MTAKQLAERQLKNPESEVSGLLQSSWMVGRQRGADNETYRLASIREGGGGEKFLDKSKKNIA